jgi:hypothetical protein
MLYHTHPHPPNRVQPDDRSTLLRSARRGQSRGQEMRVWSARHATRGRLARTVVGMVERPHLEACCAGHRRCAGTDVSSSVGLLFVCSPPAKARDRLSNTVHVPEGSNLLTVHRVMTRLLCGIPVITTKQRTDTETEKPQVLDLGFYLSSCYTCEDAPT